MGEQGVIEACHENVIERTELAPALPGLLTPLLDQLEGELVLHERLARSALERERLEENRIRTTEAFAATRQSLLREIKERESAEQALRDSEVRFRTIFNSVNDTILIHDAETGRILDVNQHIGDLFGYTREEAIGLGDIWKFLSGAEN